MNSTTRGLSLFNPMNIMTVAAFTWQGEIKPTLDAQGRLCTFNSFINGIRAGAITLLQYQIKDHCRSVREIVTRYAPAVENPTGNYIDFIAKSLGVGADDAIDLRDDKTLFQDLVAAIIKFEQGIDFCTTYQIMQGIDLACAHCA